MKIELKTWFPALFCLKVEAKMFFECCKQSKPLKLAKIEGSFSDNTEHDHLHPAVYVDPDGSTDNLLSITHSPEYHTKKDLVRKFNGLWFIALYVFIVIGFEVISFVFYDVLHLMILGGIDEPFALLTACHVCVWVVTFIYDRYMHYHHHLLRKYGYLTFFTKTKEIRRVPLAIFSIGNAALLLVVAFTGNNVHNMHMLSLNRIFEIIASIEVFISLVSIVTHTVYIIRFNKANKFPDVYHQDIVHGFNEDMYSSPEVGFRDTECLDDILEKQSEMIRYLQQHNTNLGKRIVELTQLLPKKKQQSVLNTANISPYLHPKT